MKNLELLDRLGADLEPTADAKAAARTQLLDSIGGAASEPPSRRRFKSARWVAALAALTAIPAALAIASTLGGDVEESYRGFLTGEGGTPSPGTLVAPDDPGLPESLASENVEEARLIASNGDERFYVSRYSGGGIAFTLASEQGVMELGSPRPTPWLDHYDGAHIVPVMVGFSGGETSGLPIAGLTSPAVDRVEVHFGSGLPQSSTDLNGGFLIAADVGEQDSVNGFLEVDREPTDVVAYDADGNEIGRASVRCTGPVLRNSGTGEPFQSWADCDAEVEGDPATPRSSGKRDGGA
jgi:hypothetical protein